jgi:hypothetical protein
MINILRAPRIVAEQSQPFAACAEDREGLASVQGRLLLSSRPVFSNPPTTRSNRIIPWGDELHRFVPVTLSTLLAEPYVSIDFRRAGPASGQRPTIFFRFGLVSMRGVPGRTETSCMVEFWRRFRAA